MKIEIRRIESKRGDLEREFSSVSGSLADIFSKFKEALEFRRELRERLVQKSRKVTTRKAETYQVIKEIEKKIESCQRLVDDGSVELVNLKRQETAVKGRYKELLAGRLPSSPSQKAEPDFSGNGFQLEERKRLFLKRIEGAFTELEQELSQATGRRAQLDDSIEKESKRLKLYHQKRDILNKTIALYGDDLIRFDQELAKTIEEEELLIEEYIDFMERLSSVVSLPPTMERRLSQNLEAARRKRETLAALGE